MESADFSDWNSIMTELKTLHENALLHDFGFWNQIRQIKLFYLGGVTVIIAALLVFLLLTCLFQDIYFTKCNFILTSIVYLLVILTLVFDAIQMYLSVTNSTRYF